ncbi:hypothetical protein ACOBQB_35425 [Streptomyces sp. G5(2025)]|uniref:hypothetical protein n=1 Tax=Streptomyces sp. G5(2025) TaxID=3406628 RepID=UPI003C20C836
MVASMPEAPGTDSGLRAKDICRALDTGTTTNHAESLRAELERLVARSVLTEPESGLFTSPSPPPAALTQSQRHYGRSLTGVPSQQQPLPCLRSGRKVQRQPAHSHALPINPFAHLPGNTPALMQHRT